MGIISSKQDFRVHNICKNVFAKWCFPYKNSDEVTQQEINIFLDNLDYKNKFIRGSLPNLNKVYDIPQDYYLRGIYRLAESKENKIGLNIDNFFFDKVLTELYGSKDISSICFPVCVKHMDITMMQDAPHQVYEYKFDNIRSNYNDSNKQKLIDAILSTYSKCRYGAIFLSSYLYGNNIGHRTLIFFEYINNILNVYYYDPHGTIYNSWSSRYKIYDSLSIFFNEMKSSMKNHCITDIILKEYNTMCLIGIQSYASKYDIGMCAIFSSLWLYLVIKIIATSKQQNITLPDTTNWIFLINSYFTTHFTPKQMYNSVLLFMSRLYTIFTEENKNYKQELENYIEFLYLTDRTQLSKFEIAFSPKSSEEIKVRDEYLEAVKEHGYIMDNINSIESQKIIKKHVLKIINELNVPEVYKTIAKNAIDGLKLNDDIKKLAYAEFQKGIQFEKNEYTILLAMKIIELIKLDRTKEVILTALKQELQTFSSKKRKNKETYETYETYDERLRKQQKKEQYSIRQLIPSFRKKNLLEACETNEDCLSDFCYHNEITDEKNCLIK